MDDHSFHMTREQVSETVFQTSWGKLWNISMYSSEKILLKKKSVSKEPLYRGKKSAINLETRIFRDNDDKSVLLLVKCHRNVKKRKKDKTKEQTWTSCSCLAESVLAGLSSVAFKAPDPWRKTGVKPI